MIFNNWRAVITGVQTQSRRLVGPGEAYARQENDDLCWPHYVVNAKGRILYQPFKRYPVQPSYRHPAIIYNPDYPFEGLDIIEPNDDHYKWAKDGSWNYKGQGYREAFIHITDLRQEDARLISHEGVLAEGFNSQIDFLERWVLKHDSKMGFHCADDGQYRYYANRKDKWVAVEWDALLKVIYERPAERYLAWVLEIELVPS